MIIIMMMMTMMLHGEDGDDDYDTTGSVHKAFSSVPTHFHEFNNFYLFM